MLKEILFASVILYSSAYNVELDWSYILRNPHASSQQREAYFGYSVGLLSSDSSSWALVGAPRANDTEVWSDVVERGAVYLCPLPEGNGPCRQLVVTNAVNGSEGGAGKYAYKTMQDYGWLGGSLDLQPNSAIVACSPRWINQKYAYTDLCLNGACYVTLPEHLTGKNSMQPWNILVPLVDFDNQFKVDENGITRYYYMMGQTGTSAHVLEGGKEVLIGTPGLKDWTGSVAKVKELTPGGVIGDWSHYGDKVFQPSDRSGRADYFGYSIGSGHFLNSQMLYVAGSPRHHLVGKVSIFSTELNRVRVHWEALGPQVGSYFGAAVAAGDVDNNYWNELFVGAPLFARGEASESGLVVVYVHTADLDDLQEVGRLEGSREPWGRFGSALMVVGDLDRDGYRDLAVGAPYEGEGAGAVYIYRGSANGLVRSVSQKLRAKDISPVLKGFGISLSRGTDVDTNKYPDFAVGAHVDSGSAVVLRTRPVVKAVLEVSSSDKILTEVGVTFSVSVCFTYSGLNVLLQTNVGIEGLVDEGGIPPRAFFVDNLSPRISLDFTADEGRKQCKTFSIQLLNNIVDFDHPLEISFSGKLNYDNPGCAMCGLLTPDSKLASKVSLPLALGCGADGVCTPEIQVSLRWQGDNKLILRSESKVTLSISVSVAGQEIAYNGEVKLVLPKELAAHQPLPYGCSLTDREEVLCTLPNPMVVGSKEELEITVKESGDTLEEGEMPLKVICSATGSKDIVEEITLSVIEDVELDLFVNTEGMVIYSPPPAPPAAAKVTYQVINRGESRIKEVRLQTLISTRYNEITFAQITQQATSSSGNSECSLEEFSPGAEMHGPSSDPPYTVDVKLVCGEEPRLACKKVICKVRKLHLAPAITMEVAYNTTILTDNLGNKTIAFYSSAVVDYGSPTPIYIKESGVWITLIPKDQEILAKNVPIWVYLVSVLGGLIILAAVVVLCFKLGFFKRKRPVQQHDEGDLEGQEEQEQAASLQGGGGGGDEEEDSS